MKTQKEIENCENFDDGLTQVAPKGEFKAMDKETELKEEIEKGVNYPRTYLCFRELKHKCPCCKKRTLFKRIDVNFKDGLVYYEGNYMPLYRCERCWVIIGFGEMK